MRMLLEFRNLTVYRDETRVLDRFSLTIPAGQNVAILGPNGSGKSTLIKLVTRELYPVVAPDAEIRVLGRDRWVLQRAARAPGYRVERSDDDVHARRSPGASSCCRRSSASVGLWPHHEVHVGSRSTRQGRARDDGSAHLADRVMTQLSSGEARRLLVARALAHGPQALVLDEPTNSLDLRACRDFTGSLRRLAQQGTNIILVTHHLPDIIPEIDRVVVLKDGRVFRDGPKPDVLTARRALRRVRRRGRRRRAWRLLRRLVSVADHPICCRSSSVSRTSRRADDAVELVGTSRRRRWPR